jgi:hypothetical protein
MGSISRVRRGLKCGSLKIPVGDIGKPSRDAAGFLVPGRSLTKSVRQCPLCGASRI